jgi:hypothetical protein
MVGHFRYYAPLACNMFLDAYLASVSNEKIKSKVSPIPFRVRRNTFAMHQVPVLHVLVTIHPN